MKLPSLRRPVGRHKLVNGVSDAGRLQKAAAWQWFMHGAGVEVQVHPVASSRRPLMTTSDTHIQRPQAASRFAREAVTASTAADPSTSLHLPFDDYMDLSSLADLAKSHKHPQGHEKPEEFSDSFRTGREHVEKMKPTSKDKQKRHLHFLGFQKLFHKLVMSRSNKRISTSTPAIIPHDEEEVQQHYHHYIHHHHHHYYHGSGVGSFEEVEVIKQSHPGIKDRQRRRHSESGLYCQPHLELYEDEDYKVKGECHARFNRRHSQDFSKQELQDPIKANFTSEDESIPVASICKRTQFGEVYNHAHCIRSGQLFSPEGCNSPNVH